MLCPEDPVAIGVDSKEKVPLGDPALGVPLGAVYLKAYPLLIGVDNDGLVPAKTESIRSAAPEVEAPEAGGPN